MTGPRRTLRILGIRGVPAAHGGFETFAEHLALYLVQRGWRVVVYCQETGSGPVVEDVWRGVERVHIPVKAGGAAATIAFDWRTIVHAARHRDLCLTLGYNTAVFFAWLRLRDVPNVVNMDGIEWARAKWGPLAKAWFWINEWAGSWLGNHLVADHPAIQKHLATRTRSSKITMIPYGADEINALDEGPVRALGLEPGRYLTVIARPEPENSLLEIVQGFSRHRRGVKLAVLGNYELSLPFHAAVSRAASDEVVFLGAIYDKAVVQSLRAHSLAYVHGHQVGGTNPSLVEALGAGNAVLAHDNHFNRWVAASGARYFRSAEDVDAVVRQWLANPSDLAPLRQQARLRFHSELRWPIVLQQYETLLECWAR